MRLIAVLTCAAVLLLGLLGPPQLAHADSNDYFGQDAPDEHVSFQVDKSRTKKQKIVIASLLAGTVVFGGVGLLFHLDSRSASNDVGAIGSHTGLTYTPELEDTRERALSSRTFAIVGYSLGGAFAIATVVTLIMTQPGSERYTVGRDEEDRVPPVEGGLTVAPTVGGAYVGGTWSF
jgi:hypothetical protein